MTSLAAQRILFWRTRCPCRRASHRYLLAENPWLCTRRRLSDVTNLRHCFHISVDAPRKHRNHSPPTTLAPAEPSYNRARSVGNDTIHGCRCLKECTVIGPPRRYVHWLCAPYFQCSGGAPDCPAGAEYRYPDGFTCCPNALLDPRITLSMVGCSE